MGSKGTFNVFNVPAIERTITAEKTLCLNITFNKCLIM